MVASCLRSGGFGYVHFLSRRRQRVQPEACREHFSYATAKQRSCQPFAKLRGVILKSRKGL
jgi:hypothetical protein